MSKLNVYAIKDIKAGSFSSTPFMLENDEVAIRTFKAAINSNSQSQICQYYEDMQIFRLGEFDIKTGELTSNVEFLASGPDVKIFKVEEKKEECNSEAN